MISLTLVFLLFFHINKTEKEGGQQKDVIETEKESGQQKDVIEYLVSGVERGKLNGFIDSIIEGDAVHQLFDVADYIRDGLRREKLKKFIDDYNAGKTNIEEYFQSEAKEKDSYDVEGYNRNEMKIGEEKGYTEYMYIAGLKSGQLNIWKELLKEWYESEELNELKDYIMDGIENGQINIKEYLKAGLKSGQLKEFEEYTKAGFKSGELERLNEYVKDGLNGGQLMEMKEYAKEGRKSEKINIKEFIKAGLRSGDLKDVEEFVKKSMKTFEIKKAENIEEEKKSGQVKKELTDS